MPPVAPTASTRQRLSLAQFRRLDAKQQVAHLRGERIERTFSVERADESIDEAARTAWLSIASDAPYERWWGVEILDMDPASIRVDRLRTGAPLLVGHDARDQVGVIEAHEITDGGRLRVRARFGRSTRAEEIWRDVLDGIRRNASVGYLIHDLELEEQHEGINTYRVTDWEPFEGSLVPVPADPSVGVGRSLFFQGAVMEHEQHNGLSRSERRAQARGAGGEPPSGDNDRAAIERDRVRDLLAAGDEFKSHGGPELARKLIADPSATVENFKARLFESMRGKSVPTQTAEPFRSYGEGARVVVRKSEVFGKSPEAQEQAYRSGQWLRAQMGRPDAARWCRDVGMEVRALSAVDSSKGGYLVPDELSSTVIDLANEYGVFRRYADFWPMTSDSLGVPKLLSDPDASFVSESGAIPDDEDPSFGLVNLTPKKVAAITRIPVELLEDSPIAVADRVAASLARAFAKKEDQCGFIGDGTSTYGGMTGITTKILQSAYSAGKVTAAAGHDTFAEIDASDLASLVAALPAYAHAGAAFYCSQVAWSLVFFRLLAAASGNSASDIAGNIPRSYGGYPVVLSEILPAGAATDYTAAFMIGFGNLRQAASFGSRTELRMQILTERYAEYDQIGVKCTERFQAVTHSLGDTTTAGPFVGLVGGA